MKTKGVIHFFDESATMVVALFLYGIKQVITALTPETGETGTSSNTTSGTK